MRPLEMGGAAVVVSVVLTAAACVQAAEPELMSVTNLQAGDHLNVRAAATAGSEDLGDLAAGDLVEVIERNADGTWGRFIWGEANGWAAMRYLAPQTRTVLRNGFPVGLGCIGTEPFWSLKIEEGGVASFESFEGDKQGGTLSSGKVEDGYTFALGDMRGRLRPAICTDGASDRDYGWDVMMTLETGFELQGCCRAAGQASPY